MFHVVKGASFNTLSFRLAMQRTAVFKWTGAIVLDLGREGLPPVAYQLLAPLARELVSTDESDSAKQLHQLASQVSDLIKKKLGMEVYTRHLSHLQINLATRRADRKKLRAQEVSDFRFCSRVSKLFDMRATYDFTLHVTSQRTQILEILYI
jgi:hypothetical protein